MLNFDVTKKCLVGEGWCPIFAKAKVINMFYASVILVLSRFLMLDFNLHSTL